MPENWKQRFWSWLKGTPRTRDPNAPFVIWDARRGHDYILRKTKEATLWASHRNMIVLTRYGHPFGRTCGPALIQRLLPRICEAYGFDSFVFQFGPAPWLKSQLAKVKLDIPESWETLLSRADGAICRVPTSQIPEFKAFYDKIPKRAAWTFFIPGRARGKGEPIGLQSFFFLGPASFEEPPIEWQALVDLDTDLDNLGMYLRISPTADDLLPRLVDEGIACWKS